MSANNFFYYIQVILFLWFFITSILSSSSLIGYFNHFDCPSFLKKYCFRLHDGGSEFIGSWNAKGKSAFIKKVEDIGAQHFQIPKVTYNADVEAFHRTVEEEFFDIEIFQGRDNFFSKATNYIWYYNFLRKNSNRKDKSPLEILKETEEDINPQVLMLPALDLDELLNQKLNADVGGHHVPGLSYSNTFS